MIYKRTGGATLRVSAMERLNALIRMVLAVDLGIDQTGLPGWATSQRFGRLGRAARLQALNSGEERANRACRSPVEPANFLTARSVSDRTE